MNRIKVHHRADLNTLGVVANMGAYTPEGEEWLNQVVDYIDGNTSFAADFINSKLPGVKTGKPQGTYLMWLDFTELAEQDRHQGDGRRLQPHQGGQRRRRSRRSRCSSATWSRPRACTLNAGHSYGKGGAQPHADERRHLAPHAGTGAEQPRRRADQDVEHVAAGCTFRHVCHEGGPRRPRVVYRAPRWPRRRAGMESTVADVVGRRANRSPPGRR